MANWYKIITTPIYDYGQGQVYIDVYESFETGEFVPSAQTFELTSKLIRLKRGKPSGKGKHNLNIINTKAEFALIDEGGWITDRFNAKNDDKFYVDIFKNGALYFKGFANLYLTKYEFLKSKYVTKFTAYDGLKRLETFTDLTQLPTGIARLSEVLRTILNTLGFDLNIGIYMNNYPSPAETTPKPVYDIGVKVSDFVPTLKDANYYNVLKSICKMFDLSVYQELGKWILRQNHSFDSGLTAFTYEEINYGTGVVTKTTKTLSDIKNTITTNDMAIKPKRFFVDPINKLTFKINNNNSKENYASVNWDNPNFYAGSSGWIKSGTIDTDYTGESVILKQTGSGWIYQKQRTDGWGIGTDLKITIKFSAARYRTTETLINGNFFAIYYIADTTDEYYYDPATSTWKAVSGPNYWWTYDILNDSGTELEQNDYYSITKDITISISDDIILLAGVGEFQIRLQGGPAIVHNYPYEYGAQFTEVNVRKLTTAARAVSNINSFSYTLKETGANEYNRTEITLPFHDLDIFAYSLYNKKDDSRTVYWYPDTTKSLLEQVGRGILNFNSQVMEACDIVLLPGTTFDFTKLAYINLTGTDKYYLPVYSDEDIIRDIRRYILIHHKNQSLPVTIVPLYE